METYLDTYFREIWYGVLLMTIALFISSTLLIRQVDPEMFVQLGQDTRMVRNIVMIFCFGYFLRLLMSCLCSVELIRDHAVRIALQQHTYFVLSQLVSWSITELWPIIYLLSMHNRNF
jgi:hypothetical protein